MQPLTLHQEQAAPGSIKVDVFYSMITLGSTTIWTFLNGWLFYFYLPPQSEGTVLVPAALFGGAMFANRVIDAIIDPPIGYLSDRTRSRWGRRLPFMAASALPMLFFFVLLWTPPVQGESLWNLVYLLVLLELYNVAYSFLQIPYSALLPEVAVTDHHRVRVSAWGAGAQMVATILGGFVGWGIERTGYLRTAAVYAVAMLPFFYLPHLVLSERPERQIAVTERMGFRQSFSITFRNRAFRVYTGTWALYWGAMTLIAAAVPYIVTEICLLTKAETIYFYLSAVLVSLVCYPLITWLSTRLGKWRIYTASLLASAVALAGLVLIGEWLPVALKFQGIAWMVLEAIVLSGALVLSPALAAEVTDYDEQLTGQRREGAYYASWGLLDNLVSGAASALVPLLLLLGRSRSDLHGPLGVRMIGLVSGVMMLAAFFVFLRYPLRGRGGAGLAVVPSGVPDS
jgi:GPH family glycoside/pentoside/hexuronide:cation symporter